MNARSVRFAFVLAALAAPATAGAWVARYNAPVNQTERVSDVVVDAAGNVYVTGMSPNAGGDYDIVTVKYGARGAPSTTWADVGFGVGVRRWAGPVGADDDAVAIGLDAAGNVIVAGRTRSLAGNSDVIALKYDPSGGASAAWPNAGDGVGVRRWSTTPSSLDDEARAMAVGANGSVYLACLGNGDYETVAFAVNGALSWSRRYDGPLHGADTPADVALDPSGNVYVTGASPGVGSGSDYATIAYSPAGVTLWGGAAFHNGAARYNGPGNADDGARALVVSNTGLYVTGGSAGAGTSADIATIRYSLAGVTTWPNAGGVFHLGAARYDGPAHGSDNGAAIASDNAGGVVVTGGVVGVGVRDGDDPVHRDRRDPVARGGPGFYNGAARYTSPGMPQVAFGVSVAVDTVGDVYVTGTSMIMPQQFNYVTHRYAGATGAMLWSSVFDGPTGTNDDKVAALVQAGGYVYVTGSSVGVGTGTDYATVRYSAATGLP